MPLILTTMNRDVSYLCSLHLKSFQGFLLTTLGPRFLHLLYAGPAGPG